MAISPKVLGYPGTRRTPVNPEQVLDFPRLLRRLPANDPRVVAPPAPLVAPTVARVTLSFLSDAALWAMAFPTAYEVGKAAGQKLAAVYGPSLGYSDEEWLQ